MYLPIKILIADDHDIFRDGFKLLLKKQTELELVGEAGQGREVLQQISSSQPDVILTDIQMPVMDGIALTKELGVLHPHIGIIALTMFNDDNMVVDMLEAGARGYLLKNTNKNEVIQAVKAVYAGGTYYCNATSNKLTKLIAASRFNPYKHLPKPHFTERETGVMKLICQQYSTKEIAKLLKISGRTVDGYREKIQEKTDAKNMVGIAMYAVKHNLFKIS